MTIKLHEFLLIVLVFVGMTVGAFYYGMDYGRAVDRAKQAAIEQAIQDTRKQAMEGAADAIGKITVRNTTVQGKVETIIRDNPVYRDCQHAPDQLRNINEVLTGRAGPAGNSSLPAADGTH